MRTTFPKTVPGIAGARALAIAFCLSPMVAAQAAPAQFPLLGNGPPPVVPNVMFTLDDSGSMSWDFMPDDSGVWDSDGYPYIRSHPQLPVAQEGYSYIAVMSTQQPANDWLAARQRSSSYNSIYYNPEIRYGPWTKADGTLLPQSTPSAARNHPTDASWGSANLVGELKFSGRLCTSVSASTDAVNCRNVSNERIAPATYYDYIGPDVSAMTRTDRIAQLRLGTNYRRVRIMDSTTFTRGPNRTDCPELSAGVRQCSQDQEYQNFANWHTYNRTRLSQAISGLSAAFSSLDEGMRLGFGRINLYNNMVDGVRSDTIVRGVRPYNAATRTALFDWMHNVGLGGRTPLPRAQDAVGMYFMRKDNAGPWAASPGGTDNTAHLSCRKSYQVLMTDGGWQGSASYPAEAVTPGARLNVDGSNGPLITGPNGQSYQYRPAAPFRDNYADTLADVAMYYWNRDLRPDLPNQVRPSAENPAFWQNLTTFAIGFGIDGNLRYPEDYEALKNGTLQWPSTENGAGKIDNLWHAAINGHGRYLSADNGSELDAALKSIMTEIARRSGSTSGIAVNGRVLDTGLRKYMPSFLTGSWSGEITAVDVSADGVAGADVWRASAVLPAHGQRRIFVGTGESSPTALSFQWNSLTAALKTALGTDASASLVNYLRGDQSGEGAGYRVRESRLGDVVNSSPVHVQGGVNLRYQLLPEGTPGRDSYTDFVTAKKNRAGMVWFGANDGMLHALRDTDGVETFAYIPRAVVANLALLAKPGYEHRYYVDGPLIESDAYWSGAWKNVLVGSTGAGARSVFALDVTQPSALGASSVLWELDGTAQADLGHVLTPIEVGMMPDGKWAAIFGNGYDSTNKRASLFIVDLKTGALIRKLDTGAGGVNAPNGLGGVRLIRDGQQTIVGAYAGDLLGNVWMFDLASATASDWSVGLSGSPLFTASRSDGTKQAITAAPNFVTHPSGGRMVLVGTGKLFEDGDQRTTARESLFGLWDKQQLERNSEGAWGWGAGTAIASGTAIKAGSFVAVQGETGEVSHYTISAPTINWQVDRGWTLPLTMENGQRVLVSPQLLTGLVLVETVAPRGGSTAQDPCDGAASAGGYNLLFDPVSAAMSAKPPLDLNGDGVIDGSDPTVGAWKTDGWGGASSVLRSQRWLPCEADGDCTARPASPCPAGQVRSNLQNVGGQGLDVCVSVPGPQRWWWRQVANP